MRDQHDGGRPRVPLAAVTIVIALAVVTLVTLSPFIWMWTMPKSQSWADLSNVGQAYGGISAAISALALCAIAASLLLQWRQTRATYIIAQRERHFDLVKLALDNPSLAIVPSATGKAADIPIILTANLWFTHWQMLWNLNLLGPRELGRVTSEAFGHPVVRLWWETVNVTWSSGHGAHATQYMTIVNEECRKAALDRRDTRPQA